MYTNKYNSPYIKTERKRHMIISVDTEKSLWQNQQPFMIKIQENLGMQGTYLAVYGKPIANVNLNGEKLKKHFH